MEIKDELPMKLEYQRMREYSAYGESEDPELIQDVLDALRSLEIGRATDIAVEDYGDIIRFIYADGSEKTFEFEDSIIVTGRNERFEVEGDLSRVRRLLSVLTEGEE